MAKRTEKEKKQKRSIGGAIEEAKGRVKEAMGALTDDDDMKREGALDRVAGDAKERISEAVDKVREGVDSLLSKDPDADDEDANKKP